MKKLKVKIKNWWIKNRQVIVITCIGFSLIVLAISNIQQYYKIIQLENKSIELKEEINKIELDYQFLKYNQDQLKEV